MEEADQEAQAAQVQRDQDTQLSELQPDDAPGADPRRGRGVAQHRAAGHDEVGGAEQVREPAGKRRKVQHVEEAGATRATAAAGLFSDGSATDLAALDWLRAQPEDAPCKVLLQQVMDWSVVGGKEQQRALAKEHGVTLSRTSQSSNALLLECVRK